MLNKASELNNNVRLQSNISERKKDGNKQTNSLTNKNFLLFQTISTQGQELLEPSDDSSVFDNLNPKVKRIM